tara:strand:+ start:413 stop:787 length:375 start_codon:yes stop_codon:yes gene_type:complete
MIKTITEILDAITSNGRKKILPQPKERKNLPFVTVKDDILEAHNGVLRAMVKRIDEINGEVWMTLDEYNENCILDELQNIDAESEEGGYGGYVHQHAIVLKALCFVHSQLAHLSSDLEGCIENQ